MILRKKNKAFQKESQFLISKLNHEATSIKTAAHLDSREMDVQVFYLFMSHCTEEASFDQDG